MAGSAEGAATVLSNSIAREAPSPVPAKIHGFQGPSGLWLGEVWRGAAPLSKTTLATLLAFFLSLAPAWAVFLPGDRLADPAAEARAQALGREVRCMVCQGQSIEDSDADLARDLRRLIRERMEAGDSDGAIRSFLHARYGDFVLLRPPLSAFTLILWSTPLLALILGLGIIVGRRQRLAAGPAPLTDAERMMLERITRGS